MLDGVVDTDDAALLDFLRPINVSGILGARSAIVA